MLIYLLLYFLASCRVFVFNPSSSLIIASDDILGWQGPQEVASLNHLVVGGAPLRSAQALVLKTSKDRDFTACSVPEHPVTPPGSALHSAQMGTEQSLNLLC